MTYVLLPALEIEDILLEEDSTTRNSRIDAGEQCRIALLIVNNSFQEALDVEPVVQIEQGQKLQLSEPVKIARVTRDERVTYRVTVQAPADLRTGEVLFSVYLKEKYGNGTAKETFRVPTSGR